jgi:16S rRNA (uracil1498-N3)-methyltransferase
LRQLQQDQQPDQQQRQQEGKRLARPQRAGGQRAGGGARHHPVDVAVPQIVHHAARRPHHHAAQREQQDQPQAGPERLAGEQDPPKPGQEQQPDADRPVEARQQGVGHPGAGKPRHPTLGDDVGMGLHGATLTAAMPGSIRLFVTAPLQAGAVIGTSSAQAHYLATVMRREPGATVLLFNGVDGQWRARIAELGRGTARLAVETQTRRQAPEPGPWLAFAPLKRDATDLVVQKATELGAEALLPVQTARTQAERVNLDRLRAIAQEAAEQAERLTVPEIWPLQRLPDLLAAWPRERRLHLAVERAESLPWPRGAATPAGLLVGPEGGFARAELDAVLACPFAAPVTLGPLVLRAETACVAGLALLRARD